MTQSLKSCRINVCTCASDTFNIVICANQFKFSSIFDKQVFSLVYFFEYIVVKAVSNLNTAVALISYQWDQWNQWDQNPTTMTEINQLTIVHSIYDCHTNESRHISSHPFGSDSSPFRSDTAWSLPMTVTFSEDGTQFVVVLPKRWPEVYDASEKSDRARDEHLECTPSDNAVKHINIIRHYMAYPKADNQTRSWRQTGSKELLLNHQDEKVLVAPPKAPDQHDWTILTSVFHMMIRTASVPQVGSWKDITPASAFSAKQRPWSNDLEVKNSACSVSYKLIAILSQSSDVFYQGGRYLLQVFDIRDQVMLKHEQWLNGINPKTPFAVSDEGSLLVIDYHAYQYDKNSTAIRILQPLAEIATSNSMKLLDLLDFPRDIKHCFDFQFHPNGRWLGLAFVNQDTNAIGLSILDINTWHQLCAEWF